MDANKATQELAVIRQMMARPIRFSAMSGMAAIWAGLMTIAGVGADYWVWAFWADHPDGAMIASMGVWCGVFAISLLGVVLLTWRRERREKMPFWSPVKKRILVTVLPPFVASMGLTAILALSFLTAVTPTPVGSLVGEWSIAQGMLIPAIWMLFYGVTLWQLGQFSPVEVKVLGAAFILAGLATALLWQWEPYWAMGITFGGFHILYGLVVWARHGG